MLNIYSLAILITAIIAVGSTILLGLVFLPLLSRLKMKQTINEEGPNWHLVKQGTPTMGGIFFIVGSALGLFAGYLVLSSTLTSIYSSNFILLVIGGFATCGFSLIGFLDDYAKVVNKANLGLRARQKLVLQAGVGVCFLMALHFTGNLSALISIPFVGEINLGLAYYPLALVLLVGVVNAVNLTDGVDGLASSVTMWVMCGFLVLFVVFDMFELSLWACAIAGSCIGFLFWNFFPAKVFMGDTGSMFLGGAVAVMGFCTGHPEITLMLGLVYIIEALSVMIQVSYFKITKGKRLFKMTPIHHHFEMIGWSEPVIVGVFSFVTLTCAIVAVIYGFLLV